MSSRECSVDGMTCILPRLNDVKRDISSELDDIFRSVELDYIDECGKIVCICDQQDASRLFSKLIKVHGINFSVDVTPQDRVSFAIATSV